MKNTYRRRRLKVFSELLEVLNEDKFRISQVQFRISLLRYKKITDFSYFEVILRKIHSCFMEFLVIKNNLQPNC